MNTTTGPVDFPCPPHENFLSCFGTGTLPFSQSSTTKHKQLMTLKKIKRQRITREGTAEFTNAGTAYSLMVNLIGIPASGKSTAPLCKDPFFHKPLENRALDLLKTHQRISSSQNQWRTLNAPSFDTIRAWTGGTNTHPHFLTLAS